jgi:hypothetical protein
MTQLDDDIAFLLSDDDDEPASPLPTNTTDDSDWAPISLVEIAAKIRNGEYQPITPTVLAVTGAMPLFYPERTNSLFGESGGGKTWVALAAAAETVRRGQRVLYADWEDNPAGIAERLVLLGLTDEEIALVDYRNPTSGIVAGVTTLQAQIAQVATTYTLVIIDSTGEAMAAGGVDSNADADVAIWFAFVKQLLRLPGGPVVIVLDHIPKDKDAPSSYAIGSQRKRAAITGAAYRVDTIKEPAKGRDGKLKLTVAKDRPGNRPKGSVAAIIDMITVGGMVDLVAHIDESSTDADGKFRPTTLMEKVSRFLEQAMTPASKAAVERGVTGKATHIRQAIDCLVEDGHVVSTPSGFESVSKYRAPESTVTSNATGNGPILTSSPSSPLVPTSSRDEVGMSAGGGRPSSPPSIGGRGTTPPKPQVNDGFNQTPRPEDEGRGWDDDEDGMP